jgi:hypothetical protein
MTGLLDISAPIKAHKLGRDEVVLMPVRELREGGPAYTGTIRFGDGRYFRTAVHPEVQNELETRTGAPIIIP